MLRYSKKKSIKPRLGNNFKKEHSKTGGDTFVPGVNQKLNVKAYPYIFQTQGIISIPNFLDKQFAEEYLHFLTQEMKEEWWHFSAFFEGKKTILENTLENQVEIKNAQKMALETFLKNEFSYNFYRTYNNHFPACDCLECRFRKICQSPAFIKLISQITGIDLNKNNELFISRYGSNSFLTVHNDQGNGKIAFVINLTKNWKPQYGGNFHLLSNDRETILKVISPTFNSLTVFKVPDPGGVPHFVSHVVPDLKKYRYAIGGWFS